MKGQEILAYIFLGPPAWDAGCHSRIKGHPSCPVDLILAGRAFAE